jgi:hypothetical protein
MSKQTIVVVVNTVTGYRKEYRLKGFWQLENVKNHFLETKTKKVFKIFKLTRKKYRGQLVLMTQHIDILNNYKSSVRTTFDL